MQIFLRSLTERKETGSQLLLAVKNLMQIASLDDIDRPRYSEETIQYGIVNHNVLVNDEQN